MPKRHTVWVLIHADRGFTIPKKFEPEPTPGDSPRERAERAIAELKEAEISTWLERPGFEAGSWFEPYRTFTWQELPELNKLAILQKAIDWSGVTDTDKGALIMKELDARMPEELYEAYLKHFREPRNAAQREERTLRRDREKGRER